MAIPGMSEISASWDCCGAGRTEAWKQTERIYDYGILVRTEQAVPSLWWEIESPSIDIVKQALVETYIELERSIHRWSSVSEVAQSRLNTKTRSFNVKSVLTVFFTWLIGGGACGGRRRSRIRS
ncbi:MAG: hypothetical protein U0992_22870 [Planctomycetaceae bacterium]